MSVSSIDPDEVARFSALAAKWWDPKGAFAPLHRFNPIRLEFIRDQAARAFGRDPHAPDFNGLRLLDVGCGGGLLSEPMARLGFAVTAIDASDKNIKTAQAHAEAGGLAIDFRATTVEDLAASNPEPFDLILNMEVIEHVAEPKSFIANSARLLAPSGFMIVATLNRTLKAHLLGVVGAEYVLRWLPVGTHDWRKFIKPVELSGFLREAGLSPDGPYGVAYNPLTARFSLSPDTDVNYMMIGRRPA